MISSCPVIHKVGNIGIIALLNVTIDKEISLKYNSIYCDKCKFVLKLVRPLTVSNLFPLIIVQKCQYSQLCIVPENSITLLKTILIPEHPFSISPIICTILVLIFNGNDIDAVPAQKLEYCS